MQVHCRSLCCSRHQRRCMLQQHLGWSKQLHRCSRCARSRWKFVLCTLPAVEQRYVHVNVFKKLFDSFLLICLVFAERWPQTGRLELWVDVFTPSEAKITPLIRYEPVVRHILKSSSFQSNSTIAASSPPFQSRMR